MKDYELSILFHPDLEMNLDPAVDKVKKLIEPNKGVITKEETEGKKRMNYKIDGQDYAIYYYADVQFPPEAISKVDAVLNITDEVLRHLLVKADPRKAKYEARRKAKAPATEEVTAEGENN